MCDCAIFKKGVNVSVRFVSTATSVPVVNKLFSIFLKTVHHEFICAVESKIRDLEQESFDVFLSMRKM